jgi:hypothetical protein
MCARRECAFTYGAFSRTSRLLENLASEKCGRQSERTTQEYSAGSDRAHGGGWKSYKNMEAGEFDADRAMPE